jgi:protein SCO1/2
MNRAFFALISILVIAFAFKTGCRRQNAANEKRFELKGKVVAVEPDKHLVTVAHEEIKNYMPGMTMPFMLPDEATLGYLASGDEINATLVVDNSQSWLENVVITRQSTDTSPTTGIPKRRKATKFRTSHGESRRQGHSTHNFNGKALLLTFIYTRCPLPEYCNLMSTNFADVDRALKQPDVYSKTHLLSITIDPEYDTPRSCGVTVRPTLSAMRTKPSHTGISQPALKIRSKEWRSSSATVLPGKRSDCSRTANGDSGA